VSSNANHVIDPVVISDSVEASACLDFTAPPRGDKTPFSVSAQIGAGGSNSIIRIDLEFEFTDQRSATPTEAKRLEFKDDVSHEIIRLQDWAARQNWIASAVSELTIIVSDRYAISKSLVPAWSGRIGYMEFPTSRVVSRKAAILHELVHVFFPNGNRFLAEGFAVHLQAAIGNNPAFPNFAKPLHETVLERALEMTRPAPSGSPPGLGQIRLVELDSVATPNPLTLRVGDEVYGEDRRGQAFVYPIAGSFVQFLIEAHGMEKFRALYAKTPLMPLARNAGSPERWLDIYRVALADLETEWKSMIASGSPALNDDAFARALAGRNSQ